MNNYILAAQLLAHIVVLSTTCIVLPHSTALRTKPSVILLPRPPASLQSEPSKNQKKKGGVSSSVDTPGSLHLCCLMPVEKYKL